MHGQVASLNVAVATGILLFEGVRQRRAATATAVASDLTPP
jgi:tRNA G18 (ribose-2'-O)-methylase SpoU